MSEYSYPSTAPLLGVFRENGHDHGAAVASHLTLAPSPAYPMHASNMPRDLAVFLKDAKGLRRVLLTDLLHLEADGNYVEVYLRQGRVVLRNSMSEVLKCLPENIFFMVNRSQAVNILLLDGIGTDEVVMGRKCFTLTRRYREDLLKNLHIVAGR